MSKPGNQMSQLVLDDQLDLVELLPPLQKWITVVRLRQLRPDEHVLDDRVPEILRTLNQPTFITIDKDFWDRTLCHPDYAILYFALRDQEQELLPGLLRALFRLPAFRSRRQRMGKVARISAANVDWWQFRVSRLRHLEWEGDSPKG
jgi:hypothetical protein